MKKQSLKIVGGAAILALVAGITYLWTPKGGTPDYDSYQKAAESFDVRIIRDSYGVPHIFGKTDGDTAFGLAFAHSEDDWETIQDTLIASRGMAAQFKGKSAGPTDYLFDLFKVEAAVNAKYSSIDTDAREVAEGYAAGINHFASLHKSRVKPGLLPVTGQDVIAGVTWATPFFYRMDEDLAGLFTEGQKPQVSPWGRDASVRGRFPLNMDFQESFAQALPEAVRGSNAFAVAPKRSDDGHTRLIINSHQPMTGPYAWYEAHTVSEEGTNIAGAGFPGTPIMAQGVTPYHGWGHTVNKPDLVDIYALETDREKKPKRYKLGGKWEDFEISKSKFRVKLWGHFSLPIKRDVLWSKHGPVLDTPNGFYALRFAGLGEVNQLSQWIAMGKARSLEDWQAALDMNGLLSFNAVWATADGHIGALYNAQMPKRIEGPDWLSVLPGDRPELIWTEKQPVSRLPQATDPEAGWVFSANHTPFKMSEPESSPKREDFSPTYGVEYRMTNRSLRGLELMSADPKISREELLRYRADTRYHPEFKLWKMVIDVASHNFGENGPLTAGQEVLRNWNGDTSTENRSAALAIITGLYAHGSEYKEELMDPIEAYKKAVDILMAGYGRLDPKWGEVNRIKRGDVDVAIDGGPDVLRAIYADPAEIARSGSMNSLAGDTHIMLADWDREGRLDLVSIHNYGSATLDETSPHFSDQTALFAKGGWKAMPTDLETILAQASRDYRPAKLRAIPEE